MGLTLDIPTLIGATILLRFGQSFSLAMLWLAQPDYRPAKEWAIGSFACALGLMTLLFTKDDVLVSILSSTLLLFGWLIFDIGVIRATGSEPLVRLGCTVAAVALAIIVWFYTVTPFSAGRTLAFHIGVSVFDLAAAWSCIRVRNSSRSTIFLVLGVSLALLGVSGILRGSALLWEAPEESFASTNFFGNGQYGLVGMLVLLVVTVQLAMITIDRLRRELERQARRDALTDALNRRGFIELADRELARAARRRHQVSIISVDIDSFKTVNDRYGHDVGDLMLKAVSDRAQQSLRPEDIWARFGGEEFVAMLVDAPPAAAERIAERLRASVAEMSVTTHLGITLEVTVSIGIASLEIGSRSWSSALSKADQLLYEAKTAGRNTVRSG